MRILKCIIIICATLQILACTSHSNTYHIYSHPPMSNNLVASPTAIEFYPYQVKIYTYKNQPQEKFEDVAEISVDKFNRFGFMRQTARIKTLLREEATILGGDAVIILPDVDGKACKAEVIIFVRKTEEVNSPQESQASTSSK